MLKIRDVLYVNVLQTCDQMSLTTQIENLLSLIK